MRRFPCGDAMWAMALVGAVACGGGRGDAAAEISIGREVSVRSVILDEDRTIQIALPSSYAANHEHTRYPVLYLLDGQMFFQTVTAAVGYLSADASPHIPEMIVVGITSQQRVRDSSPSRSLKGPLGKIEPVYEVSGGADRFLRFLTEELVPYIDERYSTSGYRVLVGYSFTGLTVMHSLFTQPRSFNAYLAIDPSWWWDDYLLEREARSFIASASVERRDLFVTTTTNNPPPEFFPELRYVDTLAGMLAATPVRGLRFGIKIYDDETHHSLTLRSVYDGLTHIFQGFAPGLDSLYAHPERLEDQYRSLSGRLGTSVFLGQGLIDYFGGVFLETYPDVEKAILFFDLNARHYPGSSDAWRRLAEGYVAKGDHSKAIESYRRSLALDPEDREAVAGLKKLEAARSGPRD